MPDPGRLKSLSLWKRQAAACAAFGLLLVGIMAALYLQHRQREEVHRRQQTQHRLDSSYDLIVREIARVGADATYLANRLPVRQFASGDHTRRDELLADFALFVGQKTLYDQLRLLDLEGRETIRINLAGDGPTTVPDDDLQNKSDRYYFRKAKELRPGELLVSEFDLNLEHGSIETPLKPVIRFVAPVLDDANQITGFLVLNYLGASLLDELAGHSLPGYTILLRCDSHYIHAPDSDDAWGWLLDHNRTFASQFPQEWETLEQLEAPRLTDRGLFAARTIPVGCIDVLEQDPQRQSAASPRAESPADRCESITIVSYVPRVEVYAASNELLIRLLILGGGVFLLAILFSRPWARATLTRQQQAERIAVSEERLRELSSRLLQIQEDQRRAISREIHDQLGQQATAVNLDLKLAQRKIDDPPTRAHLERAIQENEALLSQLHDFARRIRPAVLDDLGLQDALESHLSEFQQRTGVEVAARLDFSAEQIPDTVADNAFRLIQEALNNVARHAEAAQVEVEVVTTAQQQLRIVVADDGRGHPAKAGGDRLGLIGMQERVDLLGGEIEFTSEPNLGTRVAIRLPLSAVQQGAVSCL